MPADLQKARELFLHAVGKLPPEQWDGYVGQACAGNAQLEQQVGQLLQVHREAGSFLDRPAAGVGATWAVTSGHQEEAAVLRPRERTGTVVGPYKLLQQIGEGGMGTVFMAEQMHPVQRKVALKVIKAGIDSRQVIARFEAERQAMAVMDHVNIARVLDAGTTESGLPYFVMELVHGVPMTRYCDDNHLTTRERLELFVPVCQAIQHAHQKGIIHRDIKPSNVMVTLYDGKPVPKVIDFGVAKAIEQRLTERTLFTQYGTMVGTPEYMSPEQAEMSALGADTRSDIYSLGVLLYELLTGSTPLTHKRVKEAAYGEVLRMIKEEEPTKPSTRLSDSRESLAVIAAQRQTEPAKLAKLMRGELDWIVMRCLEKDRNRRYETANSFAADLERYLKDEPVKACPPSARYRFQKFARRNKRILATTGLVVSVLITATVVSTWQAIRATAAEGLSQSRLRAEIKAQNATRAQLRLTEEAQEKAMHRLYDARLAQARAGSLSRRVGQRFNSLVAVAEALKIARDRNLGEERLLELRNAAIACLALPDLRITKVWNNWPTGIQNDTFDSNLERYARVDRQGNVQIHKAADETVICRLPGMGPGEAWTLFSPDGQYLALSRLGPRLKVWRLAGPEPVVIVDDVSAPGGFGFTPDSRRLAIGYADGSIRLYDLPSNRQLKQLNGVPRPGGMMFHPDGRQLAVSCAAGLQVYDLETARKLAELPLSTQANSFAWHPGGKTLAVACNDSRIYLWDVALGKQTHVLEGSRNTGIGITFNHKGDLLASGGWEGVLRLWDPRTGTQLFSMPTWGSPVFGLDDRLLATDIRGKLGLWEVAAGGEYRTLVRAAATGQGRYDHPAIRSDGRVLAVGTYDGVGLWDLRSGKELGFLESPGTSFVLFEASGALLTNGSAGLLRWPIQADQASPGLLRIGSPQKLSVPGPICHIASSGDGKVIAVSQFEGGRVLHAERPDQPVPIGPHDDARYVDVSHDGRWVVTGSHNGTAVKIWDARTGELEKELLVDSGSRVGFSPDGKWLATTGGGLRLWAVGSWREGPQMGVAAALAFSPDGKLLAVDTADGSVRLVDPDTGREFARLENPHQDRALFLSFSPNGTQLVTTKGDSQSIHVWDLRAIREQLVMLGLDWDMPPFPSAPEVKESQPLQIQVQIGDQAIAPRDREENTRQLIEQQRRALEANPNDAKACNDLAWTYLIAPDALRDWKAALPLAEKSVQLAPGPMFRNTLGLAYFRAGRFREAAEILEPNLKDQVDWALAYDLYFLAMSHRRLGESTLAREFHALAVRWSDAHHEALKPYAVELAAIQAEAAELLAVKDKQR